MAGTYNNIPHSCVNGGSTCVSEYVRVAAGSECRTTRVLIQITGVSIQTYHSYRWHALKRTYKACLIFGLSYFTRINPDR